MIPQVLPEQVAVPFGSVGHTWPHVPQLATFVVVSAHMPAQRVGVAVGQPEVHVEPTQAGVPPSGLHALLQLPQCGLLIVRSTHAPPQSVYPLLQVMPHVPPLHAPAPLVTPGHLVPQPPQLFVSLFVSTQVLLKKLPHDFPQTPVFLVQHPPAGRGRAAAPPASVGVAPPGWCPCLWLPPSARSPGESSTASGDASSPESVPTTSSAPSGTVTSSPVVLPVSGFW